jgi:quercetin dioxygenase-like cupin family protein
MNILDVRRAAAVAAVARADRPATAVVHDSPDVRLIVFRIEPHQVVATHTNASTVVLTVIEGTGFVSGNEGERAATVGDVIVFEPREPHAMRSNGSRFMVLAAITPRPGDR